ncbi:hypothetical protein [Pedobacter foliorum]|uniref:hypothetical protein n=1 Tax=Pedobacter foliorum TaxID=2739058 RepID=UPI001567C0BC|nr:hypothetical protein [Pedobacter foliorum]NRF41240.1 hypothetical protein [Pedobacter foliorum]
MRRKINPLIIAMIIANLSPLAFKIFDSPNKTTDQYIWVHYDRNGVKVLNAGMINSLAKVKKDVFCIEKE